MELVKLLLYKQQIEAHASNEMYSFRKWNVIDNQSALNHRETIIKKYFQKY